MREIPDKSIDLVITDPPYGIGIERSGTYFKKFDAVGWDTEKITEDYFKEIFRISQNQVIWGGNYYLEFLGSAKCFLIWDKCIAEGMSFASAELAWTSFDKPTRLKQIRGIEEEKTHPTQKPVKLFEWIIKNYAKEGDTICDPFFGSGSCLVAAVRMGHQFIGFEKELSYFEKAQVRIKKAQEQGKIGSWFE